MARKAPAKAAAPTPASVGPEPEVVRVYSHRVACDGVGGALGHPRVYLELGTSGSVDCPYCDRRFVMSAKAGHGTPGVYEDASGH